MALRVVFAGTPEFAVPCLRALLAAGVTVPAVYTQPDRPAGRGRQPQPSPVKQVALQAGIPLRQPTGLRDAAEQAVLAGLKPDLMVVVAYGLLLPQKVLQIPRYGCWNVHASLLPRWRGAAPIQRAIEAGDAQTGVCLMQMERGLDTGPVLLTQSTPIAAQDDAGSLHDRLSRLGAALLGEALAALAADRLPPAQPQPAVGVTYAHKLDKAEARLDWTQPAALLARRVRAFSPWPVAEAEVAGERLRIHAAEAVSGRGEPGSVLAAGKGELHVACGEGALRLLRVQRDGGRVMAAADFLNARRELSGR
jgi:methionyl-tRNA formyltransferase